jgi:HD-like signal output (HDOD) protein
MMKAIFSTESAACCTRIERTGTCSLPSAAKLHAEIGAYLLGLWGILNLAVEAIAHHHHSTRIPHAGLDSTVAVYVANLLAHELEDHPQGATELDIEESDPACLETLGILHSFAEFRQLALQTWVWFV